MFLEEDIRDYVLLNILSVACKPTGRVKVDKKIFKPSAEEARDAFILRIPVSMKCF